MSEKPLHAKSDDLSVNSLHENYVPRYSRRSVFIVALSFMALASVNALVTLLPFLGSYEPRRGVVALVCAFFGAASLFYLRRDRIDRAVYAVCAGLLVSITLFQVTVSTGVRAPLNAAVVLLIPFAGLILGHKAARNALLVALGWLTLIVLAEVAGFIRGMQGINIPVLMPSYGFYCGLCICIYAITDNYASVVEKAVKDLITEQNARSSAEIGKAEAEAVLRYKDEFLAMLSHEIRTPLSGVKSGVQLLSHPKATDAMRERAFMAIRQAVDNTVEVLNNLLDNSKIDAGKLVLNKAPVDLGELLDKISRLYQVQAEARGLDFEVDVEGVPEGPFALDAPRLTQMMSNLLGNAIKFTTRGGVTLKVENIEQAPAFMRAPESAEAAGGSGSARFTPGNGPMLRFSVIDTGPGLSKANRERLFQEYVQVKESGYTSLGTGLGLVVVRKLAWLMGGTANVDSEEGKGSTFWFTVAVDAATADQC